MTEALLDAELAERLRKMADSFVESGVTRPILLQAAERLASPPPAARAGAPREPTDTMIKAALELICEAVECGRDASPSEVWKAMYDAAPEAPPLGQSAEASCPFCGSDNIKPLVDSANEGYAICLNCGASGPTVWGDPTTERAMAAFGRRATPSPAGQGEAMPSFRRWAQHHNFCAAGRSDDCECTCGLTDARKQANALLPGAPQALRASAQPTPPAEVTDEWPGCKHGNPEKNCPICDYEDRAHE